MHTLRLANDKTPKTNSSCKKTVKAHHANVTKQERLRLHHQVCGASPTVWCSCWSCLESTLAIKQRPFCDMLYRSLVKYFTDPSSNTLQIPHCCNPSADNKGYRVSDKCSPTSNRGWRGRLDVARGRHDVARGRLDVASHAHRTKQTKSWKNQQTKVQWSKMEEAWQHRKLGNIPQSCPTKSSNIPSSPQKCFLKASTSAVTSTCSFSEGQSVNGEL